MTLLLELEAGSLRISLFLRTACLPPPSLRCVSTRSNLRTWPRQAPQDRGGVAQVGRAIPGICTCSVDRDSTVKGVRLSLTTYGNALQVFRLIPKVQGLAPAHGPWQ